MVAGWHCTVLWSTPGSRGTPGETEEIGGNLVPSLSGYHSLIRCNFGNSEVIKGHYGGF